MKSWLRPKAGLLFAGAAMVGALAGCGAPAPGDKPGGAPAQTALGAGQAEGYDPAKAFLSLEEIPPRIEAPAGGRPAGEPAELLPQVRRALAKAEELFEQRRYTEAILALEKGLRYSPAQFELQRMLGVVCFHAGSTGRAKGHLDRAVELNPDDVTCHYLLGRLAASAEDRAAEINELRLALKCSNAPGSAEAVLAHLWLGGALEATGHLTAAIEQFEAYDRLMSEAPPSLVEEVQRSEASQLPPTYVAERLSALSARLGQLDRAVRWAGRAVELAAAGPERIELQTRYAELAARAGRADEARRVVRRLLEETTPTSEELKELEKIYATIGRTAGGGLIDDLQQVASAHPEDSALWTLLAGALLEAGRPADAEEVLRQVIAHDPLSSEPYWQLAGLQAQGGRSGDALVTLAEAVRAFPGEYDVAGAKAESLTETSARVVLGASGALLAARPADGAIRYLLGRVAAASGLPGDAEAFFVQAMEVAPEFLPPYLSLGERYLRAFAWDKALSLGQRAIAAGQDTPSIQRMLARAYDGLDRIEEAERAYQNAIQGNRQDSASIMDLARMWSRLGKQLKAQRQYQAALAVNPAEARAYEALVRGYFAARELQMAAEMMARMRRYASSTVTYARTKAWFDCAVGLEQEGANRQEIIEAYAAELQAIAADHPNDPDVAHDLANTYYALDRIEQARRTVDAALAMHPHHLPLRELLVRLNNAELAFEDSEKALRSLVVDYPNRGRFWAQLVQVLLVQQDWPKIISLLEELIDRPCMSPWRAELQAELLNALDLTGRSDEALALAREWLAADESDAWARQLTFAVLHSADRTAELVEFAEAAYAESPTDEAVRGLLITAYQAAGRYEAALSRILEWLEADPESVRGGLLLLETLTEARAYDSAVELCRNMRAADDQRGAERLIAVLLAAGRNDEAVQVCRSLPRREPVEHSSRYALVLMQAKRYKEAERVLSSLEKRLPRPKQVLLQLAFCYQRMEETEAAENALLRVMEFAPKDVEILNDLGYTWADAGKNLERAEEMIRAAVAARPRTAAYLDSLGWVRYKRGDFAGAVRWLRMATWARPALSVRGRALGWVDDPAGPAPGEDPIIYDHLGDAQYRLGNVTEAERAWRQALDYHAKALEQDSARDDSDIIEQVEEKLAALARGEPPEVAPIGRSEPSEPAGANSSLNR